MLIHQCLARQKADFVSTQEKRNTSICQGGVSGLQECFSVEKFHIFEIIKFLESYVAVLVWLKFSLF